MTTSALLLATTPSADGGLAATLPLEGGTVVGRLLGQLPLLGVRRVVVVTRPAWADELRSAVAEAPVETEVLVSGAVAEDIEAVAAAARRREGRLLLGLADAVLHREALGSLMLDPRIVSGALGSVGGGPRARLNFRVRASRGRIVSAGSPYHGVGRATGWFLGFLKIDARDLGALAASCERVADLLRDGRPAAWEPELEAKTRDWRLWLEESELEVDVDEEVRLRRRAAEEDAISLVLVGLVRGGTLLSQTHVRGFVYARPQSAAETAAVEEALRGADEDRLLLSAAVKGADGFFTTFFVSPYSRYIARFAARRGWTPNAMTTVSLLIGAVAAAAFATGSRPGLVAGALLLQAAFTVDCVDGQLARYTRTFSKLGAWLDSVFDRGKEYLVYAGLAIGATRGFGQDVWALAGAALTLQSVRHALDFSFGARHLATVAASAPVPLEQPADALRAEMQAVEPQREPVGAAAATAPPGGGLATVPDTAAPPRPAPAAVAARPARGRGGLAGAARGLIGLAGRLDRSSKGRWLKRIVVLPIGERFALISVTAALFNPRVTFIALLAWGGFAAAYSLAGRFARSVAA